MAVAMSAPARPVTLLIVDDEPSIVKALLRVLRDEGYRVLSAYDAEEALRLVAAEPVDVVLSDIDMPGMSGLELMSRLRRNHPAVVRLVLTGRASLAHAVAAINDGEVFRFMTKPWDMDELREVLRQAAARAMQNRSRDDLQADGARRAAVLDGLEREHPGLTAVALTGGMYCIDPLELRAALQRLGNAPLTALLGDC